MCDTCAKYYKNGGRCKEMIPNCSFYKTKEQLEEIKNSLIKDPRVHTVESKLGITCPFTKKEDIDKWIIEMREQLIDYEREHDIGWNR